MQRTLFFCNVLEDIDQLNTTSTLDARKTPFWWRLDLIAKISPSSMRAAR